MKTEAELYEQLEKLRQEFNEPADFQGERYEDVAHNLTPEWRAELHHRNKYKQEVLQWILGIGDFAHPMFAQPVERQQHAVFRLTWIYDADTPGGEVWAYQLQVLVASFAKLAHRVASASIEELHPTKGSLSLLKYSSGMGLYPETGYLTHDARWEKSGYQEGVIAAVIAQYPEPADIVKAHREVTGKK